MSTIKSPQQQLSRESENALRNFFENNHEWSVVIPGQQDDFGTDGEILIFEDGRHNQQKIDFQLKSTEAGANKVALQTHHLDMWQRSIIPFFIFFWNKSEDQIYYLDLHEYHGILSRTSPEKLKQESITVSFTEKLDAESIENIKRTSDLFTRIFHEAIQEHRGKEVQIKDFLGQERISAMGYSFAGHNIAKQNLQRASVMGANFENTILSNADMRGMSAMSANFRGANLSDSDLRNASVMGAYFENADMRRTKLEGTAFMGAFLAGADFRGASFNELSLWSIGKAYDFEKAQFDEGVLEMILPLTEIANFSTGNAVSNGSPTK